MRARLPANPRERNVKHPCREHVAADVDNGALQRHALGLVDGHGECLDERDHRPLDPDVVADRDLTWPSPNRPTDLGGQFNHIFENSTIFSRQERKEGFSKPFSVQCAPLKEVLAYSDTATLVSW